MRIHWCWNRYLRLVAVCALFAGFAFTGVLTQSAQAQEIPAGEDMTPAWHRPVKELETFRQGLSGGTIPPVPERYRAPVPTAPRSATMQTLDPLAVDALAIDVWYGNSQTFGSPAEAQKWVNILGTTTDAVSLTYALNGGAAQNAPLGPDGLRLVRQGDFNIELDYADLNPGPNQLLLTAEDAGGTATNTTVTINYAPGDANLPFNIDWSPIGGNIQSAAQIADGQWQVDGSSIRLGSGQLGYDRLVLLGDLSWTEYEVTVPVTFYSIDEAGFTGAATRPNIGLVTRWRGHEVEPTNVSGTRPIDSPRTGWTNLGGLALVEWYPDDSMAVQMRGFGNAGIGGPVGKTMTPGVAYIFKLSVQTDTNNPTGPAYYRFKFWPALDEEPIAWDIEGFGASGEPASGSVGLQAHFVDASFGPVTVRPLTDIQPTLTINPDANGTAVANPEKTNYAYGERVDVYPAPEVGYRLSDWGGDGSGLDDNPLTLFLTQDVVLSPTFEIAPNPTISVVQTANGIVTVTPDKEVYDFNDDVRFAAVPAAGYQLLSWGGNQLGNANPLDLMLQGDVIVEPVFGPLRAPFSDDFNSCALDDELWVTENPAGDGLFQLVDNEKVEISVPGGTTHDLWDGNKNAPRLLQTAQDTDFDLIAKLESPVSQEYQIQGLVVKGADGDYLRADFYSVKPNPSDPAQVFIFGGFIPAGGGAQGPVNLQISPPAAADWYIRLTRVGDQWTVAYSFDGNTWNTAGNFAYAMTVSRVGMFAGNAGGNPQHTAVFDYFFNSGAPIEPEDGQDGALDVMIVGQGEVNRSPDKQTYACDEEIQLTAVAAEGYDFAGWSGYVVTDTNPLILNFDLGLSLTATFEEEAVDTYSLTANVTPAAGGTVATSPEGPTYADGTVVTLTATPAEGYRFVEWQGDAPAGSTNPILALTMDADKTVTAVFAPQSPDEYTLTVLISPPGTGTVTASPNLPTYQDGTEVTLTAISIDGYRFTEWRGDVPAGSTDPTLALLMDTNRSVTAVFEAVEPPSDDAKVYLPYISRQ